MHNLKKGEKERMKEQQSGAEMWQAQANLQKMIKSSCIYNNKNKLP
jgi:hypothetical protein